MRRGHPGMGGWRNENPRHFRPRNGGNQHFRPSRAYGHLDQHRFPPPVSRPHRPLTPYKHRSGDERTRHDQHDRGKYRPDFRANSYQRNQEDHQHQVQHNMFSTSRPMRSSEISYTISNKYPQEPHNYYDVPSKHCHMNSMGDIDDRYVPPREPFRQNPITPWASNANQIEGRPHRYEHNKSNRYETGESSKLPLYDYTGHRPPSSDHYGGNPTPVIDNSGSFNRSVDDTVDLIRKRLLNRNDPHSEANDSNLSNHPIDKQAEQKAKENIQGLQKEQPMKKRINRQIQIDKSNIGTSFTKIRSKIINQLFKMDKEKIHKLMDNPKSSSKFEYAISSLITESQYSFNRHLRSVAEKSLPNSRSIDFMQNDNNTIYEDTFMKQMQCILDPQDTVMLEDIKPIVMAELSKALELNEYEQQFEMGDNEIHHQDFHGETKNGNEYYDTYDDYNIYPTTPEEKFSIPQVDNTPTVSDLDGTETHNQNQSNDYDINDSMYESRSRRQSKNLSLEPESTIDSPQYSRINLDDRLNDLFTSKSHCNPENPLYNVKTECQQVFVPNTEPLEDEDDPFAELDKQYHVAVDPSFIQYDDSSCLNLRKDDVELSSPNSNANITLNLNPPEKESVIKEIVHQLQDMANSPLKFPTYVTNENKDKDEEVNKNLLPVEDESVNCDNHLINSSYIEKPTFSKSNDEIAYKEVNKDMEKSDSYHILNKTSVIVSYRKRSLDQSPSHRKEKRKKINSICNDGEKQPKIKNIDVSNENTSKQSKKEDKQSFPEKHIRRKESHKKTDQKDCEVPKKRNSTESLTSSVSPKESHNSVISKLQSKSEVKATLKTFDLFRKTPKKVNIHHAHRNTALAPDGTVKTVSEPKTKKPVKIDKVNVPIQISKNMHSVQVQTIDLRTTCSRFSQTDKKRHASITTQTNIEPSSPIKKNTLISTDPLERMKEIDMEVQSLLQEKFRIYNSIENKESVVNNSLHILGMTILNLSLCQEKVNDNLSEVRVDENVSSENTIVEVTSMPVDEVTIMPVDEVISMPVDEVTIMPVDEVISMPVVELEQIACESIEAKQTGYTKPDTRNRQLRVLDKEKSKSKSPSRTYQKKNNKKRKSPNILLIDEIISDKRPIEDIISLDELEDTPIDTHVRNIKSKRKPKRKIPARVKPPTRVYSEDIVLKECSVLIVKEDFSKYLPSTASVQFYDSPINNESVLESQNNFSDEPINDLHFDMLDVSEDIVISDICEIKTVDDKEELCTSNIPVNEDIILDNSQSSIEEHQSSTSDPKENKCKMFDYSSHERLQLDSVNVTGHADAVLAIECIENNFIAACLDGNVYYFSGDGKLITTLRGSNLAVTCLTVVKDKSGTTVYTGSLDSRIRYYDLETGIEKGPECNVLSPIQTMDRAWDTVFVGTRTGFVLQFECKNNMLIPISTVQFSEQSILALRAMKEGPRKVLLVAARSENVTIKDAQTGLLLRTLVGPKMTVYTLLYEDGKIYCGTSSSQIHVFDYSSGGHVGAHEGGKGAVCLRSAGGLLFAGCYDGCVYVYREGERAPFAQLRGPSLMLLSLAILGSTIIAGYKDRSLYIWKIPLSILQEMIL